MPGSIRATAAKILSNYRRHCKTQCDHRQKERLHHPRADPESCLRRRTEISDDPVDDDDVDKEKDKLSAGWDADAQHRAPDFHLCEPQRKPEAEVTILFLEVPTDEQVGDENGNEGRECRTRDTKFRPRSDPEDQKGSEYDIHNHADHLEDDWRLKNSGRAQGRAHRDERELQQHRWKKPE